MTDAPSPGDLAPGVMTEYLTDDWGSFIRSRRTLESFRSQWQAVEVHDTVPFGKLFRLDGHFMTSEKDEFYYHENLVHIAGLAHAGPERALVIGGGDGGSTEELLKYPSMKAVTVAEIDAAVVDIARRHLQEVHHGAFDDPRVKLEIGDGFQYVRDSKESYDLIVLDLTDPGGPSTELYTHDFYLACAKRLTSSGALTLHVASPVAHHLRIRTTIHELRRAFHARDAVSRVDTALRRAVDDGLLRIEPRPARAFGDDDRPAHLAARDPRSAVPERRHLSRGACASELRPGAPALIVHPRSRADCPPSGVALAAHA